MRARPLALALALIVPAIAATRADEPAAPPREVPASRALEDYVGQPEPSYGWTLDSTETSEAGTIRRITLTSQEWHGTTWRHQLRLYEPAKPSFPGPVLLWIDGGSTTSTPSAENDAQGFALAALCGARVAVLPQVPNQPLLDGLKEDDLISETFLRYLATDDPTWPLLLPMVKSAVKAMDCLQEFGEGHGGAPTGFVVTGASKRGWTTWLVGAIDPRVDAIAPVVIPTLNFARQNPHQIEVWGKYSEQIDDYVRKGLMEKFGTPAGASLTRIVDPYFYLGGRLATIPKLQVNGTNDRYWTLDSMNLYWKDLEGPSCVLYLPNAGHNLRPHTDEAFRSIAALFRLTATNRSLPRFDSVQAIDPETGTPRIDLRFHQDGAGDGGQARTKSTQIWWATSPTQDFREAHWSTMAQPEPHRPDVWLAQYADLTCEVDGLEFHLSTPIQVVPPKPN